MSTSRRTFLTLSEAAAAGGFGFSDLDAGFVPGNGDFVQEPAKQVPVVRDVDVVVTGAGTAGLFAALGSAKYGAKTILVDRFGELGGNIGPGMIIGGTLYHEVRMTQHDGALVSLPKAFMDRVERFVGDLPRNYPAMAQAVCRTAVEMMQKAGVEMMLSAYGADPILEGNRVRGLFVETKSGRVAIRAKVVIDATGDADAARRAGAPFRLGCEAEECKSPNVLPQYDNPKFKSWNELGLYFVIANAEIGAYNVFARQDYQLTAEDNAILDSMNPDEQENFKFGVWTVRMKGVLLKAWKSGEFRAAKQLGKGFGVSLSNWFDAVGPGLVGGRTQARGEIDTTNWQHISLIEAEARAMTYDGMKWFRRSIPGFENAYLVYISPFLGARGGPHIQGEHTLTPQESWAGYRSPDAMFISYTEIHRGAKEGYDMPYGMLVPKKIDGLLVTGRGAAYLRRGHDPSTRGRTNLMVLGQATGMAAALAVKDNVTPRALNTRKLQQALLAENFYLGDDARLAQLGLK